MKLLPPLPRLPGPRMSSALLGATALELAVLVGHLIAYPFGLTPERRPPRPRPTRPARTGAHGPDGGETAPRATTAGGEAAPHAATALPLAADDAPPVVLLHGFIDNRSAFVVLRRALTRHGHRHLESLNYSPLTRDIRAAADLLGLHVEEICARTGHSRVDIVGHSLGGLIARYYVQRLGGDRRVRTLVTLGTPHGGTAVAPGAGIHPIVRQMRGGSSVIEELRTPAPGCRTRFVSFWSELDQVMVPVETACVDHPDLDAVNVRVTGIGHLALPVHPTVAAAILEALDAPEAGEDTATATGSSTGATSAA
ncbi:lipase [Streptomyces anulatus]|uniref:lipase family alpha/beta hydrolase n=1 Tax=Streptomyces TaxID=1883 RepID=UPI0006D99B1B|nr:MULTISPECIES: alpha/beta fold hydrolase [Streptomyces]KPL32046.1 lipase [Streptomyces anulatus]KQX36388.1 lipase [Streptomyces sp. Root1295]KRA36802.1 lipase [Streptomyces sp. Root63]MBT1098485.1 alpha/beta fold hydrolase [Streptomyces sp. Tu10]WSC63604.1 alpha/beta fold hydrolase [Streptomyces anulatus]